MGILSQGVEFSMTIQDIAREAGVSIATVSRVINGTKEVSPELKKRVDEVIERNNFKPNPIARGLVMKKTHTIGFVVTDISNAVIGALSKGISRVCEEMGYSLMVFESGGSREKETKLLDLMEEKTVDGVLFAGVNVDESFSKVLRAKNYPIVLVTQESSDPSVEFHTVIHDSEKAAFDAVQFLIDNGHSRIAFIGGPRHDYSNVEKRRWGYDRALKENHLEQTESYIEFGDFSFQSGFACMKKIYEENALLPTAVLACSDTMALGAVKYLQQSRIHVPEEISVMGFDDMDLAVYSSPELSTVRISYFDEGVQAAKMLLSLIKKKKNIPLTIHVDHKIIRRQSVARIE